MPALGQHAASQTVLLLLTLTLPGSPICDQEQPAEKGQQEKGQQEIWPGYQQNDRAQVIADLQDRSDAHLREDLQRFLRLPNFRSQPGYEMCLCEIVRRCGTQREQWAEFLQQTLTRLNTGKIPFGELGEDWSTPGTKHNLELLTALRRVQDHSDPLRITITWPDKLIGQGAALPRLHVRIENADIHRARAGFRLGGNYRSGRQTRWRIHLVGEDGREIPVRGRLSIVGGGICDETVLEHGQTWETSLDVSLYVRTPLPGEYTLTVQYHDHEGIAGKGSIDGRIVTASEPVRFVVKPVQIVHNARDRQRVRRLVSKLDEGQPLKVVAGTYGEWASEFVAPASPAGQLLGMGMPAVPTLVEALHDESMTRQKRAWLLSILYSLTGENDPRDAAVIGSHECWHGRWQIIGSLNGEQTMGSFGGIFKMSVGGEIQAQAQQDMVKAWDQWLQRADVKDADLQQ